MNKPKKSELSLAIERLKSDQSIESQQNFAKVLSSYVKNQIWVPIPTQKDEHGERLDIFEREGKCFTAMFSSESEVKGSSRIVMTDMYKLLDPLFQNDDLTGIIINPHDTSSLCLEKWFLLKCILHADYPAPQNMGTPPRDWGQGIPTYKKSDLMTEHEIQNFALQTVLQYDKEIANKFDIISMTDYPNAMPSIILISDSGFAFVKVKGYTSQTEPALSEQEKNELLTLSKHYNAKTYLATVGFFSTDTDRYEAELALKGDGFYCKYEGLQEIK